jgi:hypothetical protein
MSLNQCSAKTLIGNLSVAGVFAQRWLQLMAGSKDTGYLIRAAQASITFGKR